MLTTTEKEYLYEIISAVIGNDQSIRQYRHGFNERTVEIVEEMIVASARCNAGMKQLLTDLMLVGSFATKGWLKKIIKKGRKALKVKELHGYGCLVAVKSRWKNTIIISAI